MSRIGMFGTFDVGNFGDLLFPIVAEHKLKQLTDVELVRFSYNQKRAPDWCYDVEPISGLPDAIGQLDLAIIGGGHLIHFNPRMASGYGPDKPLIPHPLGFWWLPALTSAMANVPVAVHGVSSDSQLPDWGAPLLESFVGAADYLTVRDNCTAQLLSAYCKPGQDISVVPDSIFSVADLVTRGAHSQQFKTFCETWGLAQPYVIAQPSDALWRRKDEISTYLRAARVKGWDVMELPIGFGIGNYTGFYSEGISVRPREWPDPLLLAELIANAEAVIGVSLHLSVVASCYGIPVYRPSYAPTTKFVVLDNLPNVFFLENRPTLRGLREIPADFTLVERYRQQLDRHWKQLARLVNKKKSVRPMKARGAWPQLCMTPSAFQRLRGATDRRVEMIRAISRRRQFLMHRLRKLGRTKS